MKKVMFIFSFITSTLISKGNLPSFRTSFRDSSIKESVSRFLTWYYNIHANSRDSTYRIPVISGGVGENEICDISKPYRINFWGVKRYIQKLKEAEMFSSKFLDALNNYYVRCDSNFINHRQYCGEPMGFDEVPIFRYMDDTGIRENRNNFKIVRYKKKCQTVFIKLKFTKTDYFTFELTKLNGKWLIDKVNGDFPTEIDYKYDYNNCCRIIPNS